MTAREEEPEGGGERLREQEPEEADAEREAEAPKGADAGLTQEPPEQGSDERPNDQPVEQGDGAETEAAPDEDPEELPQDEPEQADDAPAEEAPEEPGNEARGEPGETGDAILGEPDETVGELREPADAAGPLDLLAELDAILELGRRAPGSDAERRTALHLKQRLEALGRDAETESLDIHPAWPLAYAILAAAVVAASVLAVYVPVAGAALALSAVLLTVLDAGLLVPTLRRLLGRRASQNVVSWGGADKAGAVVLVAHYDAGRAGIAHSDLTARRRAAVGGLIRRPIGGLEPLFWAELAVLVCTLLRVAGVVGTPLTVVQFVPTLVLIVAVALLTDIALAGTRGGENDNASGSVMVLRLAERFGLGDAFGHFDVHVLFTGAQQAGSAGMRAFLKSHPDRLGQDRTVFLNVDKVGSGSVRYTRREGSLLALRSHPQLVALCDQIAEDDNREDLRSIVSRSASDASAAGATGFPAITVTCRDRLDYASGRVDEQALQRAESVCAELIERLDAEIGPSLAAPDEETALSEPEAT
ncbi:MAG: M28 family peptidase [Thermoleophilaceae bacterium]|nr:M28 family peptidase [Thermoleophilaceae bacterium]